VIIETAGSMDVDIIIMGTHGRTGLSHTLMGSIAEKVARLAPCPVLSHGAQPKPQMRKAKPCVMADVTVGAKRQE
jgi:hypothetical protein